MFSLAEKRLLIKYTGVYFVARRPVAISLCMPWLNPLEKMENLPIKKSDEKKRCFHVLVACFSRC